MHVLSFKQMGIALLLKHGPRPLATDDIRVVDHSQKV